MWLFCITITIKVDSRELIYMTKKKNDLNVSYNGKRYPCSVSMVMNIIGGRWKCVILYYLQNGEKRFSELKKDIPDITEMTLSLQLKQLEKEGLVSRTVYGSKPPIMVKYQLTALGHSFKPVLAAITSWSHTISKE